MNYKIINVKGDGSCFFRSIYKYLKYVKILDNISVVLKSIINESPSKIEKQQDFIIMIRMVLSKIIKDKNDHDIIKDVYKSLSEYDKETYDSILEGFPSWFSRNFKKLAKTEDIFRDIISEEVKKINNWVGEIEVSIIKQVFYKLFNIKIEIFNSLKPNSLINFKKNTIYIINYREEHYNSIFPDNIPIFNMEEKTPSPKKEKNKKCPKGKILNPSTNRCVIKTSCTGLRILCIENNLI